jgi:hypothetical protein
VDVALLALQQSELAQAMRQARWLYPAVNTAHILALATLYGSLVVLHLRALGLMPGPDVSALDRLVTPVAAAGLVMAALSGLPCSPPTPSSMRGLRCSCSRWR